ncbi:hypothetical protein BDV93DRAFT_561624 [Ceratobasidium sp. AG-I]|nr:hypothetical protein BDV93DRAFT_561624 [Ceratobasidium sp. AG-I]
MGALLSTLRRSGSFHNSSRDDTSSHTEISKDASSGVTLDYGQLRHDASYRPTTSQLRDRSPQESSPVASVNITPSPDPPTEAALDMRQEASDIQPGIRKPRPKMTNTGEEVDPAPDTREQPKRNRVRTQQAQLAIDSAPKGRNR